MRPAQPEEIAPAYVFLASPQCSSYITGEILPIIGGYKEVNPFASNYKAKKIIRFLFYSYNITVS